MYLTSHHSLERVQMRSCLNITTLKAWFTLDVSDMTKILYHNVSNFISR